jgi:hypothetical protein
MNDTTTQTEELDDAKYYIMATVQAAFRDKDGNAQARTLNALLETESPNINREMLDTINEGVLRRLKNENGVDPNSVFDIVFINICPLGLMTHKMFHGEEEPVKQ